MQIPQLSSKTKLYMAIGGILVLAGLTAGYYLYRPNPPVQQVYHAEEKLPGGAVVAEVKPDASAKPSNPLRKGDTFTRKVSVTIKAKLPTVDIGGNVTVETKVEQLAQMVKSSAPPEMVEQAKQEVMAACEQQECPPVTVNIDLVRDEAGQQRAVASSPDGEILAALDIPKEDVAAPVTQPKWAAGANFEPFKQTVGAWVDRDLGPFRVGAEVNQLRNGNFGELEGRVKVGIRF